MYLKMIPLVVIALEILSICSAQRIDNPELVFKVDENIHFEHFEDLIITKEYKTWKGKQILDTVYSCNYNNNGKIKIELRHKYNTSIDGTTFYQYDSLNRLDYSINFTYEYKTKDNEIYEVFADKHYYNEFDSISCKLGYYCKWNHRSFNSHLSDSGNMISALNETIEEIEWEYIGRWVFNYDSLQRLVQVKNVLPEEFNSEKVFINIVEGMDTYEYDSSGRLSTHEHIAFSLNGKPYASPVTDKFIYTYFSDSLLIVNPDSTHDGYSESKSIKYNTKGKPYRLREAWKNNEGIEIEKITFHFYDEYGRLKRKEVTNSNLSYPSIFRYYYKE